MMHGKLFAVVASLVGIACFYLTRDTFDPESVRGKRVLVTGASAGIGEQLAYRYAELGARLLLTARQLPLLQKVASRCRQLGAPQVDVLAADMSSAQERAAVTRRVEDRLGGLDYLILNHAKLRYGLWSGSSSDFSDLQEDLTVNFVSHVHLASSCLPMLNRSRGSVGVVSSGFAELGSAMATTYSANKHALHGFFASWRQELRRQNVPVSVTLCVLGPVGTENFLKAISHLDLVNRVSVFMTSPQDAAEAVVRGVAARVKRFRHNRASALILALNDVFYDVMEDVFNWYLWH